MKIADTISVNPSKTALGHTENPTATIFRNPVLCAEVPSHSMNVISLVFPTSKGGVYEYKKYEVPLRALFATILIVTGISLLTGGFSSYNMAFAICGLSFGTFLALGLFTRPVMIGAAVYYCITGALAIRSGAPDVSVFSLMFGCLIFAVIGSGKYSFDALIRKSIMRHKKSKKINNKVDLMDYKVFHKIKY